MSLFTDLVTPLPAHIAEYKALVEAHWGVTLNESEAQEQLEHLLILVRYRRHLHATTHRDAAPQGCEPDQGDKPDNSVTPPKQ